MVSTHVKQHIDSEDKDTSEEPINHFYISAQFFLTGFTLQSLKGDGNQN